MTVPSTVNRNDYVGNGATSIYPYTFQIYDESNLEVWVQSTNGSVSKKTISDDYTVSGVGISGGGNVTLSSALADDYLISIKLVLPLTQLTDLKNQGNFFPEIHERVFDRLVRISQQLADQYARAIKFPETEIGEIGTTTLPSSTLRVSKLLGFDGDGDVTLYNGADNAQLEQAIAEAESAASDAAQSAADSITSITYQPLEKTGTTYTLEAADCSVGCVTILELSNNSFTDFALPTPTSLGVTVGKGFNVVITGTYGGQTLAAGSGATLLGSPAFTDTNHCKTVIAWSTTAWRIFG